MAIEKGLKKEPHKYKIIYLQREEILSMFIQPVDRLSYYSLKEFKVPEGTEVKDVYWNAERHAFSLMIFHHSFPIVPDGERIPEFQAEEIEREIS